MEVDEDGENADNVYYKKLTKGSYTTGLSCGRPKRHTMDALKSDHQERHNALIPRRSMELIHINRVAQYRRQRLEIHCDNVAGAGRP